LKCTGKIAAILSSADCIDANDRDVCAYGLEILFMTVLEVASIILISALVGNFLETVVFFIAFVPLRIYAGGYHADTRIRCYLISLVVYSAYTLLLSSIQSQYYLYVSAGMSVVNIFIVYILAPVIHSNKSAGTKEYIKYKKISRCIVIFEVLVYLIMIFLFKSKYYSFCFVIGQTAVTFSMIAAALKAKINKKSGNM